MKKKIVYVGKPYTVDRKTGVVLKVWDKQPTTSQLGQLAKESR